MSKYELWLHEVTRTGSLYYGYGQESKRKKRLKKLEESHKELKYKLSLIDEDYIEAKKWISYYWHTDRDKAMEYFRAARNRKYFRITEDGTILTNKYEEPASGYNYGIAIGKLAEPSSYGLAYIPDPIQEEIHKPVIITQTVSYKKSNKLTRKEYINKIIDERLPIRLEYDDWIANCFSWAISIELENTEGDELLELLWDEIIWWADSELAKELNITPPEIKYL